jgi:hypothetical protein
MKKPIFGGEFPSEGEDEGWVPLRGGNESGIKGRNYLKIYSKNGGM